MKIQTYCSTTREFISRLGCTPEPTGRILLARTQRALRNTMATQSLTNTYQERKMYSDIQKRKLSKQGRTTLGNDPMWVDSTELEALIQNE